MLSGCTGNSIVDWRKAIATYTAGFMTSYLQCGQTAISRGANGCIQYRILAEINKLEVRVLINSVLLPLQQLYAERSRIVFFVWWRPRVYLSVSACLCVSQDCRTGDWISISIPIPYHGKTCGNSHIIPGTHRTL